MTAIRAAVLDSDHAGMRLDLFVLARFRELLARKGPAPEDPLDLSRSAIQKMIAEGHITLNGRKSKPGARLKLNDMVEVRCPPPRDAGLVPEPLPLDILYEDGDCIVVNKAPGVVVHPAAGRERGTLVNALLHHCPDLRGIGGEKRPGIVHRLDKDTSGVIVIAKHGQAFQKIARQFKEREVRKEYVALVWGRPDQRTGVVERPVGRHARDRKKMSSRYTLTRSRDAVTEWRVVQSFAVGTRGSGLSWVTLLRLWPRTGRTHQIRVHMADQGNPVLGDRIYGCSLQNLARNRVEVEGLVDFPRQALHAERLGFRHPRTGAFLEFHAPMPDDMKQLLETLRGWASRNERTRKTPQGVDKKTGISYDECNSVS